MIQEILGAANSASRERTAKRTLVVDTPKRTWKVENFKDLDRAVVDQGSRDVRVGRERHNRKRGL